MPQILRHKKVRRATMLTKRTRYLRNYSRKKCSKPLYEKLKDNNNCLAKALSKEKQESRLLFSQKVALIAEIQDLGLACNKRDKVILKVLQNAKEMLKMLVTMTGYVTNTISSCQEFVSSSNMNLQMSCNSTEEFIGKNSSGQLLTKTPTKGVVKPMVGGYTITKPTINLSRVNMQCINNLSNLSTVQEVSTTPEASPNVNANRSSHTIPIDRPHRYGTGRTCRMPERLPVASPRRSDEDEQRFRKRSNRHSGKISGKCSKSGTVSELNRLSNNFQKHSTEYVEHMGSPCVKLNDVSKLLQNSQSLNIRMMNESQTELFNDSMGNNTNRTITESDTSRNSFSETQTSINHLEEDNNESRNDKKRKYGVEEFEVKCPEDTNKTQINESNWEDPLEGPSWRFNNSEILSRTTHEDTYDGCTNIYNSNGSTRQSVSTKMREFQNASGNSDGVQPALSLSKSVEDMDLIENSEEEESAKGCNNSYVGKPEDKNLCTVVNTSVSSKVDESEFSVKEDITVNFASFVTQRRGRPKTFEDDIEDFTLMYMRQPAHPVHFDINDLRLPVLEGSMINPLVINEPEPEVTTTLQKITQKCPIPSVSSNDTIDDFSFNRSVVKPSLSLDNTKGRVVTPMKNELPDRSQTDLNNHLKNDILSNLKKTKRKSRSDKDPSAAKVVLQKLNEVHVKQRTPSSGENSQYSLHSFRSVDSLRIENLSDSENNSMDVSSVKTRPRRKKAPVNLQEPSLIKKLRRCK